ncbi:MAG: hypothetical protein QOH87_2730 [Trebonia sp.]|jgi:hypothetical protein|nr:hypothetical protein [Mycobacterium sp.]MDX6342592.1 hypothetical protein [Trebonia sp.]
MSMANILVTSEAQAALDALNEAKPEQARAVHAAISDLGTGRAEPLHIPGAPPDTPFLAVEPSVRDAPVVVYRRTAPDEPGDWLVVSLLSPQEYLQVRRAEQTLIASPGVGEIVNAIVDRR